MAIKANIAASVRFSTTETSKLSGAKLKTSKNFDVRLCTMIFRLLMPGDTPLVVKLNIMENNNIKCCDLDGFSKQMTI